MTVTDSIIKICDWLNEGVCKSFAFKKEPSQNRPIDAKYEYEEVHPHAFPLFIPAKDKLPPKVEVNMPSICVQILEGSDDVAKGKRDISIQLGVSTWNPGTHIQDVYGPVTDIKPFRSGYDGWMDTWNFIDAIVRKIESMTGIDGLYLALDVPVRMGPFKEQDAIADYYPHWFGYIQFTLRSDFMRHNAEVDEFL